MSPGAYFACDLPMAAFCASALSLVPATAAEQAIASGQLNATLKENLAEICNVSAQLFRGAAQHVTFVELIAEPDRVAQLLAGAGESLDLTVEVAGYGSGRAKLAVF
jgi:signal transduction histidine kinase